LWGPSDKSIDYDYINRPTSDPAYVANFGTYIQKVTDDVSAAYAEPGMSEP